MLFVGTGAGPWHTSDGLTYGDGTLEAGGRTGCDPYGRNPTGSRDYDDSEFNAVSCERRYGKRPLAAVPITAKLYVINFAGRP